MTIERRITFEIEADGDTPEEALQTVYGWLTEEGPSDIWWVFQVDGQPYEVNALTHEVRNPRYHGSQLE